jgi:hypothetical protein
MKFGDLALSALSVLALNQVAHAQSASANFTGNSTVNTAISIGNTASLHFGTVVPNSGGTVSVSSTNLRTVSGGVVAAGGHVSAAGFVVYGTPSTAYSITLPGTADLTGPGTPMVVTFSAAQTGDGSLSRTLRDTGSDSFGVGATLTVGKNQAAGSYSGVFSMTVAY